MKGYMSLKNNKVALQLSILVELIYRLLQWVLNQIPALLGEIAQPLVVLLTKVVSLPPVVNTLLSHLFGLVAVYTLIPFPEDADGDLHRRWHRIAGAGFAFLILLYYSRDTPVALDPIPGVLIPTGVFAILTGVFWFTIPDPAESPINNGFSRAVMPAGIVVIGAIVLATFARFTLIPEIIVLGTVLLYLIRHDESNVGFELEGVTRKLRQIESVSPKELATVGLLLVALYSTSIRFIFPESLLPEFSGFSPTGIGIIASADNIIYNISFIFASLALLWFWYGYIEAWFSNESEPHSVQSSRSATYLLLPLLLLYLRAANARIRTCLRGIECHAPSYWSIIELLPLSFEPSQGLILFHTAVSTLIILAIVGLPLALRKKGARQFGLRHVFIYYLIFSIANIILSLEYAPLITGTNVSFHRLGALAFVTFPLLLAVSSHSRLQAHWATLIALLLGVSGYTVIIAVTGFEQHYSPMIFIFLLILGVRSFEESAPYEHNQFV